MITFEEKKAAISNALIDRRGMQHILDTAAKAIGNPIFVMDLSMKFIALSEMIPADCRDWSEMVNDEDALQKMRVIEDAGIYNHLLHSDTPIWGKFDFYPKRYLGCRIRGKIGTVGFVCVIEDQPITEEDTDLVIHLCKTLFYQTIYTNATASQEIPAYGLIRDLIEQDIPRREVIQRTKIIHMKVPEQMRIFILEYEDQKLGLTIYMLHKAISSALPLDYTVIYGDRIVTLFDERHLTEAKLAVFQQMIRDLPIQGGISRSIDDLLELRKAYNQALSAIHIGRRNGAAQICFYDDIVLLHLLETTVRHADASAYYSPAIEKLENYDKEHDVSMLDTLETYLESGRNIQSAAEQLYIHRSSMYARLRKIEQLAKINLRDEQTCFYLQLSLRIRKIIL